MPALPQIYVFPMHKIVIISQGLSQLKLIPKSTLNPKISINFELHDSSETRVNRFSPEENKGDRETEAEGEGPEYGSPPDRSHESAGMGNCPPWLHVLTSNGAGVAVLPP